MFEIFDIYTAVDGSRLEFFVEFKIYACGLAPEIL